MRIGMAIIKIKHLFQQYITFYLEKTERVQSISHFGLLLFICDTLKNAFLNILNDRIRTIKNK